MKSVNLMKCWRCLTRELVDWGHCVAGVFKNGVWFEPVESVLRNMWMEQGTVVGEMKLMEVLELGWGGMASVVCVKVVL